MDPQTLLFPLVVLAILAILVLVSISATQPSKGEQGESRANFAITSTLDPNTYHLIRNVIFPIGDTTTQIDHLLVSPYGIFVIETKNMNGWIFGSVDRAQWTQVIYRFRQSFQNPLQQNEIHVRAVRNILGLHPEDVHNVVVFAGNSTFKTPMPAEVMQGVSELTNFISSKKVPVLSQFELDRITKRIEENRLDPGAQTEREHIRNVNEAISKKLLGSGLSCPHCGGALVERQKRQTGERFLGCKRFPRCKGSRSLR